MSYLILNQRKQSVEKVMEIGGIILNKHRRAQQADSSKMPLRGAGDL